MLLPVAAQELEDFYISKVCYPATNPAESAAGNCYYFQKH